MNVSDLEDALAYLAAAGREVKWRHQYRDRQNNKVVEKGGWGGSRSSEVATAVFPTFSEAVIHEVSEIEKQASSEVKLLERKLEIARQEHESALFMLRKIGT